jgi:hypothetical protein
MKSINVYTCEKCQYNTYTKCNYDKHLLTRKHQNMQPKSNPESNPKKEDDKFVCKDCNTKCSYRQSYERHIKKNCKMIHETQNNIIITNSNVNSNNTITNSNNTNNITLINFSERDNTFLTDKEMLNCLRKRGDSVIELIRKTYLNNNHPENKIIRITNKKLNESYVYDDDKWILKSKRKTHDLLDTLLQESEIRMGDWSTAKKEVYPESQEHLNVYYKVKDKRGIDDYITEIGLEFYNNS